MRPVSRSIQDRRGRAGLTGGNDALGKPVICYIKPSFLARCPAELPIVVADQNALQTTIASLLNSGACRLDLGRRYVKIYYDAREIGSTLIEIYRHLFCRNASMVHRKATEERSHWHPLDQKSEDVVIVNLGGSGQRVASL